MFLGIVLIVENDFCLAALGSNIIDDARSHWDDFCLLPMSEFVKQNIMMISGRAWIEKVKSLMTFEPNVRSMV